MITKQVEKFKPREEKTSFPELKKVIKESLVGARKIWQSVGSVPTVSTFSIGIKEIDIIEQDDAMWVEVNGDRQLSIEVDCNSNVVIKQTFKDEKLSLYFKDYQMGLSVF